MILQKVSENQSSFQGFVDGAEYKINHFSTYFVKNN